MELGMSTILWDMRKPRIVSKYQLSMWLGLSYCQTTSDKLWSKGANKTAISNSGEVLINMELIALFALRHAKVVLYNHSLLQNEYEEQLVNH